MKALRLLAILWMIGTCTSSLFAQNNSDTGTEWNIDELRQEMQAEMESMRAEMDMAMQQMQEQLEGLEWNSMKEGEIIINGDTIIVAPDAGFLSDDLGQMFQQLPEQMENFDLYFGGESIDELFNWMDELQNGMDTPLSPEQEKDSESPKKKNTPKNKKKKVYSI